MSGQIFKMKDITGQEYKISCIACALAEGKIKFPFSRIAETENFIAEQDTECPIEGFVIISSKKHIYSVDEMTDAEVSELFLLLKKVRSAMRQVLKIEKVTLIQEENTSNSHFHIWLFPWHEWMLEKWSGKLSDTREIMQFSREKLSTEENLLKVKESAKKLRKVI